MAKNTALRDRIRKASTVKEAEILSESDFFNDKDVITTICPIINVALSGDVDGGLTPGMTMLAGPSKHFKTNFGLIMAAAYTTLYPDAVIIFYDSEFGSPQSYFDSYGIPTDQVLHVPITDIEMLKHDMMVQLKGLERGDKVLFFIDSVGNLASKKEIEDALEGKSVADMTRAKALKSLFRMVTPHLTIKDIPLIAINHTYKTQEMYSKDVVSGGTGAYYNADNIWIIGRQQDKDGKDIVGFNFTINIEKSRYVREKKKLNVMVSFEKGVHRWSGLFEEALEAGILQNPKQGWYTYEGSEKSWRRDDLVENGEFWKKVLAETSLKAYIKSKFQLPKGQLMLDADPTDEEVEHDEDGVIA